MLQGFSTHTSPEDNPSQAPNSDTVEEVRTSLEIIPDATQRAAQDDPLIPQETRRERRIRADNKLVEGEPEVWNVILTTAAL